MVAAPALATEPFAYRWQTPRVRISWSEGNGSAADPGLRRQVGHWKRVAQSLWSEKPAAPPLEMEVSFYGPEMGSRGPAVRLRSGGRSETVTDPITEAKVAAALRKVRDGAVSPLQLPPDDSEARLSPNGQWTAMISWRGNGPEVWLAQRDAHNVVRVAFPGSERLVDRVMVTEPRWSANGQILAWIQGGRVVIYDVGRRVGRLISPAGKQAVDFWWSPHPVSPMIARYADGTVDLLDLSREAAVPLSDVLRASAATGGFYWSPSGNKVLFPIQGRIVTTDLESAGGALATIQRTLDRFLGMPAGPKPETGPNEDRLAVLDIADHRLDAFSVRGTPLETTPASEVSWALNEDLVYAVSGGSGEAAEPEGEGGGGSRGASSLIRFPLAQGQKPSTVLANPQPIHCLGPATDVLPSEKVQAHPPARLQFLAGNRVLVIQDGNPPSTKEPYTPEQIRRFTLRPGPEGGYRGVESDAITQDEPGLWTVFAPLLEGQGAGTRVLLPGGVFAVTALGSEMGSRIEKEIASGSLVGLDLYPGSRHSGFAVGSSPSGGAGSVGILTPGLDTPGEIHDDPVSRRMSEEQVEVVTPLTEAFHVVDAHSGLVRMSEGYQSATILRMILGGLVLLVAFGAILTLKRRLRKV